MCGIAGKFGGASVAPLVTNRVANLLSHRGPDGYRQLELSLGGHNLFLHHGRLAIIDIGDRSAQPFSKHGLVLIFNGEIYNYLEIRSQLVGMGHEFLTDSDTEVIIESYHRWGESCVERFEGMWSLVLADTRRNGIWMSRDRFGEKPLFFSIVRRELFFASEVKALVELMGIRPEINTDKIRNYLVNGYRTIFKEGGSWYSNIHSFPAGSSAFIRSPDQVDPYKYWQLNYFPDENLSLAKAEETVIELLDRSLSLRLRSDVPLAFCLSGGVDSTLLSTMASIRLGQQDVHCFSIVDVDSRYDESDGIDQVVNAIGCNHNKIILHPDGFFDRMHSLVRAHDAPVATISYYIHSFLSEAISSYGYKVAISGTGADELFSGYYDHYLFWLSEQYGRADFDKLLDEWRYGFGGHVRNPILKDPLAFYRNPRERGHITFDSDTFDSMMFDEVGSTFCEDDYTPNLLRNRMLNELFSEIVPVILAEDDLNSMMWGIENRSPFLDSKLAEFAYRIPNKYLIQNGLSKWLLRSAGKGIVPDNVRLDYRKRGFNASIDSLVDRSNPKILEEILEPGPIFDIVRREKIEAFLRQDMTDNSRSKFLFSFLSAKIFME